jgi:hypothetical protein
MGCHATSASRIDSTMKIHAGFFRIDNDCLHRPKLYVAVALERASLVWSEYFVGLF